MPGIEWTVDNVVGWHNLLSTSDREVKETDQYVSVSQSFLEEFLRKTKLMSQLVATSWLEDDKAAQIRQIFREALPFDHEVDKPKSEESDLRKLLTGGKPDLFKPEIFTKEGIKVYAFRINWDSFIGSVFELQQPILNQEPPYFLVNIPYPPRPALGEVTLKLSQIEDWVNSPLEDKCGKINPYPPYPYLPTTSAC